MGQAVLDTGEMVVSRQDKNLYSHGTETLVRKQNKQELQICSASNYENPNFNSKQEEGKYWKHLFNILIVCVGWSLLETCSRYRYQVRDEALDPEVKQLPEDILLVRSKTCCRIQHSGSESKAQSMLYLHYTKLGISSYRMNLTFSRNRFIQDKEEQQVLGIMKTLCPCL